MPLYKRLDADNYGIRLLTLYSGPPGSIIQCRLNRVNLLRTRDFSALSYCWGDESIKRNIIINGLQVAVTSNLEDALQRLRELRVDRVWADAVCINQADKQERGSQVRIMKQIYARAETTYAWLGTADRDGAVAAMRLLRSIRPIAGRATNAEAKITANSRKLLDFFEREYWKRRWIIQEITSAVTVHILCGGETVSLTQLARALAAFQISSSWQPIHDIASRYLQRVFKFREAYHAGNTFNICEAILQTRDSKSKDPRDKIFALIGICSDGMELVPLPNYSQDPAHVARDFSRELLRKHACIDIILVDTRRKRSSSSLPTWAPDWLSTTLPEDAHEIAYKSPIVDYSYALDAMRGDASTLAVRGVQIGTIVSLSSIVGSSITDQGRSGRSRRRTCTVSSARSYYGGLRCQITQALMRCLVSHDQEHHDTGVENWTRHLFYLYVQRASDNHASAEQHADLSPAAVYARWLHENSRLTIDGRPLKQHWQDDQLFKWVHVVAGNLCLSITLFVFTLIMGIVIPTVVALLRPGSTKPLECLPIGIVCLALVLSFMMTKTFSRNSYRRSIKQNMDRASRLERKLAITAHGMLTMVSPYSQIGDKICFIVGCSNAAVLRKVRTAEDQTRYRVIGKAFACVSKSDYTKYRAFRRISRLYRGKYAEEIKKFEENYGWDEFVLI